MLRIATALSLIALSSTTALAAASLKFDCVTDKVIEGPKPTRVQFTIENLDDAKKITYAGTDENPVQMTPAESVLMLNENWGVERTAKGILLSSDGAGCQLTKMLLFEDSGFRKGYVSVKGKNFGCGASDYYSIVTCKVK